MLFYNSIYYSQLISSPHVEKPHHQEIIEELKNDTSKEFSALWYLTGILPIKKYGTESALNNFDEFTMINSQPLKEYVGFTERAVDVL